jgi:hypothetical protein
MKAATHRLNNIAVKRSFSKIDRKKQNLCLDRGYDFQEIENEVIKKGNLPHIRQGGEQSITKRSRHHTRRWVVERTNSWHNRLRKMFVRYEKKSELSFIGTPSLLYNHL